MLFAAATIGAAQTTQYDPARDNEEETIMSRLSTTPDDMAYFDDDDLFPVTRITAGALGEPGRRIFLLQAQVEGQTITWLMEKKQVVALGKQIPRLLARVQAQYPELGDPLVAAKPNLSLNEPFDPVFRVGGISLEYDRLHDLVVLNLVDADGDEAELEEAEAEPEDDEALGPDLQVFTTRGQALLLGQQAEQAVSGGRPACPNCGEPIDEFGHFCLPESVRWKSSSDYWQ
jgi:uncharacterized repeat protein (TIGR03847 family)